MFCPELTVFPVGYAFFTAPSTHHRRNKIERGEGDLREYPANRFPPSLQRNFSDVINVSREITLEEYDIYYTGVESEQKQVKKMSGCGV